MKSRKKEKSNKKHSSKHNKKVKKPLSHVKIITLIGIILILIGIAIAFYNVFNLNSRVYIEAEEEVKLILESGSAKVNDEWYNATTTRALNVGDSVFCKGTCKIIIQGEKIIYVKQHSKVWIEKRTNYGIYVEAGELWAKVLRLTGKKEFYVRDDNFVALVEGTFFKFSKEKIVLVEGQLRVRDQKTDQEYQLEENKTFDVATNRVREITEEEVQEAKEFEKHVEKDLIDKFKKELCYVYKQYAKVLEKFKVTGISCEDINSLSNKSVEEIMLKIATIDSFEDAEKILESYNIKLNAITRAFAKKLFNNEHIQKAIKIAKEYRKIRES